MSNDDENHRNCNFHQVIIVSCGNNYCFRNQKQYKPYGKDFMRLLVIYEFSNKIRKKIEGGN